MSAPVFITPTFAVAPALAPGDIEVLAAQGFRAVISNRPDGEDSGQMTRGEEAAKDGAVAAVDRDKAPTGVEP